MPDRVEEFELTPNHTLTIRTPAVGPARHSCSCKELVDATVDAAQVHAEEVTP